MVGIGWYHPGSLPPDTKKKGRLMHSGLKIWCEPFFSLTRDDCVESKNPINSPKRFTPTKFTHKTHRNMGTWHDLPKRLTVWWEHGKLNSLLQGRAATRPQAHARVQHTPQSGGKFWTLWCSWGKKEENQLLPLLICSASAPFLYA